MRILAMAVAAGLGLGSMAMADEVVFRNGDRLTGTIKSATAETIVISTTAAGEVTINMAEVATFSTEEPIAIHLADGTVLNQPIARSEEPGAISTAPGGAVQAQNVPITSIASINPPAPAAGAPVKWTGSVSAGAMLSRGNSETESANVDFEAVRRSEDDRMTLDGRYFYSRETVDGETRTSADNWRVNGKYDHFFNERFYGYANTRVERDRIANLDLRLTPGIGVGYQWFETEISSFNTEGGITWVYERYTDPDDTRKFFAGRVAYKYMRKLNEDVTFFHNLEVLPSLEDFGEFLLTTDVGLRAMLTDNFFGEVKVVLDHNSEPAPGREKTDTRYMVNVGWQF